MWLIVRGSITKKARKRSEKTPAVLSHQLRGFLFISLKTNSPGKIEKKISGNASIN